MCMRLYGCGAPGYLTSYLLPVPAPRDPRFAAPPLVPLTRLQRSNAPTSEVSASKTAELRKKMGKELELGPFLGRGSTTESSLDKFIFRVQGESATASSFASSIFWSHFPQILYIFPFFSYVTAFKSPCFCGSVASLYSISFFLCPHLLRCHL